MKSKRIENKDLLDFIKELSCICCETQSNDVCAHHVRTVGSGGHDIAENLMPLCQSCHVKIHAIGTSAMARQHPNVKKWLTLANWEYDLKRDKWSYFGKNEAE